jgi:hypothetical protein
MQHRDAPMSAADATAAFVPRAAFVDVDERVDADAAAAAELLAPLLTVVLNTSPCTSHPCTRLLEEVAASFTHVPGLLACRLLLVADGFKLRERTRVKSGAVTAAVADGYARYLARVECLTRTRGSPLHGAELLALQLRHGCCHALRRGLARVTTPYVMVVQHGARPRHALARRSSAAQ